jgi:hypothetical protein
LLLLTWAFLRALLCQVSQQSSELWSYFASR